MKGARQILTVVHRWTGLALAGFVIVVGATGALLPFMTEIQRVVAPERFVAAPAGNAKPLDWITLHGIAEQRSHGIATKLILHRDDEAPTYEVQAAPGKPPLSFDEIVLDPYTGHEIARDTSGSLADGRAQIVPFLFLLHQNLALGDLGTLLFGVAALFWTLDCFVGFYLTLPLGRRQWWNHWRRSWRIKLPVRTGFRLNFDLHRAGGLWLWPMLLLFAWTGVAFNLPQVYAPVMQALTGYRPAPAPRAAATRPPALDWVQAVTVARRRAGEIAAARGITVERERELRFDANSHSYAYAIRTSLDHTDDGANSWIDFDADTGRLIDTEFPTGGAVGNTIDAWLGWLHEATIFGLPYRLFVSAVAIVIIIITITGVLIWLRKRASFKLRRSTRAEVGAL